MTDPFARPARPDDADSTIPLVPDSGYTEPGSTPFTDETLVEPLPAPAYQPPTFPAAETNYRQPEVGYQPYPTPPAPAWPQAEAPWPQPAPAAPLAPAQPAPGGPAYYPSGALLPDHPNATTALVLGILGVIGFWPLGPIAWYLGAKGKRELREQPGRWSSSGGLTAGMVLGMITTGLIALGALAVISFILLVAIASR